MRGLINLSIPTCATLQPIKRTEPTGGVHNPTLRFIIIIIPKWIGSSPSCEVTIGRKIGVKIKTAGVISINIPTNKRIRFIMKRIIYGFSLIETNPELTSCGMFSNDITHESPIDVPTRSITIAVILTVFIRISGRSFHFTSL